MKSAYKDDICSCSFPGEGQILANRAVSIVTILLSRLSLVLIRAYQLTRHLRQPSCRFYPSCSQYTAVGIERFGFVRGLWLGCMRILRCHPWHPGGVDEVPTQFPGLFADLRSGIKVACEIPAGWTGWGQRTRGKR